MLSERLRRRHELWWGEKRPLRQRVHRLLESGRLRDHRDPDAAWRCCEFWQRSLINKWNSREFARKHGCRVPALHWAGRRLGRIPFRSLPARYVVKPIWGYSRRNTYVMADGVDLLRGGPWTATRLTRQLVSAGGRVSRYPYLVEAFVPPASSEYELPVEYKCYTFGETVAAIQVVERWPGGRVRETAYTPSWKRFPEALMTTLDRTVSLPPPECLDEILACARRLGTAFETFVRVDLYASDVGCVFGEYSAIPMGASKFTEYGETYFERFWQEAFPDRT